MLRHLKLVTLLILVFCHFYSWASESPKVLLMGSFHFNNPGLDTIKNQQIDVTTKGSQHYIQQLTQEISKFKPTVVMLEYDPKDEKKINQQYQAFVKGQFTLPLNEMYQLGFRVAQLAGLHRVYSFDERNVHWQGDKLIAYIQKKAPEAMDNFKRLTTDMQQRLQADFDRLTLQQMLIKLNQPSYEEINRNIYLQLNATGKNENFIGADSTASWWQRNFRMYARIQRQATTGARIFALGGQGHTSVIRPFLHTDSRLEQEAVLPYLKL